MSLTISRNFTFFLLRTEGILLFFFFTKSRRNLTIFLYPSASDDDLWSPRGAPLKDTRSRNDSNSSCSPKSPASPRSESDLLTPSLGSPTLMITEEEEEESSWAVREAKKGGALTSTSTAIIEGLEKEVQWIQESLDAAEKEWDQVRGPAEGIYYILYSFRLGKAYVQQWILKEPRE